MQAAPGAARYLSSLDALYDLLPTARLFVQMRTPEGGPLVGNLGSILRGSFGAALREISGHAGRSGVSAYRYVFETPRPKHADRLRTQDYVPHPFALRPGNGVGEHGLFTFEIVLIGRGLSYFPEVVAALRLMGARGLGKRRISFALEQIWQRFHGEGAMELVDGGETIRKARGELLVPSPAERSARRAQVDFVSPAQIKRRGAIVDRLDFESLIRALLRRITALSAFHCESPVELDYHDLLHHAGRVRTEVHQLEAVREYRYSARQRREIGISGVVGRVMYADDALCRFAPLLRLGQRVHVGKATGMGLGHYELDFSPVSARASDPVNGSGPAHTWR